MGVAQTHTGFYFLEERKLSAYVAVDGYKDQ
jgi:hypothetical protein